MTIQKRLISTFVLFCLIAYFIPVDGQSSDKGFLATFPTSVISGQTAQFCIRFFNVFENVVIKIYDEDGTLFVPIQESIPSTKETCFGLQIEKSISDSKSKVLTVSGETLSGDYKFNNSKIVSVKKVSDLTFIETDKPVYKPGQKVQFRILTLDYELNPVDKLYQEIFMLDASNTRVFQWLNVKNNAGLISLDLPISEEPNFGKWKISVSVFLKQEPIATATFEVKKYVLPKFELQLKTPEYALVNDDILTVSPCAKYSYGKDVTGDVDLKLYLRHSWQDKGKPFLQESRQIKGCQEIVFNIDVPEFLNSDKSEFYIEAIFKEDDTGLTAEATKSIDILRRKYELELKDPKYYKPGLPAKIRIQIRTPDKKPVENKILSIKISQGPNDLHERKYASDANGFISINNFVSPSCNNNKKNCKSQLYIRVEIEEKIENTRLVSSSTGFSLQSWSSKIDSFLQIYSPEDLEPANCGDSLDFDIKLKTSEAPKGNLYFQVQSQSTVLYSGSFNLETNEKSANIDKSIFDSKNVKINKKDKQESDVVYNIEICSLPNDFDNQNVLDEDEETNWYFNSELKKCINSKFATKSESFKNFKSEESCMSTCSSKNEESTPNQTIKFGEKNENVAKSSSSIITSVSMSVLVNEKMSPEFSILVYYVSTGEVIPDSVIIPVKKCLKNKVILEINEPIVKTGEEVKIKLMGEPKSVCAISAIDKSVSFMGKRNAIDLETVFSKLSIMKFDDDYLNYYPETEECDDEDDERFNYPKRQARRIKSFYYGHDSRDAIGSFQNSGLLHFTDLRVYQKRNCYRMMAFMSSSGFSSGFSSVESSAKSLNFLKKGEVPSNSVTKVLREYFPETWLWNIETLDQNGVIQLTKKSPDSITDWNFNAFCLSKDYSFGIAPEMTLRVFRPFFVSVNLPYSVVSNEVWPVQVSVFNYLNKCVAVKIDFSSASEKTCACPNKKAFYVFKTRSKGFNTDVGINVTITVSTIKEDNICPANVGELAIIDYSDTEIRNVLVEPEGISQEIVKSSFVFLNATENINGFEISLPQHVVPNTVRGFFSAIGDPMGPAMNNLDNLVQQPTGCGEQNMVKFAPLVSVTKYLRDTAQLNSKVSELAKEYLKIGYQRQLTYIHSDGSYSAFGKSDKSGGGTWLTAFVLRCFAQSFGLDEIKIDQKDIDNSFKWLLETQSLDGSFKNVGTKLLSKGLSGGLSDEKSTGLTAYVLITLLTTLKSTKVQIGYKSQIDKALLYLKHTIYDIENVNTYTLALCLYTFKLSNELTDKGVEKEIEYQLEKRAVNEGDVKYWTESGEIKNDKVHSSDIELTSYILLAKLENFKQDDAASMVPIVKWINSQRNSLGGFYSTQDTVVALDALSKFAGVFYSKKINLRINYSVNDKLAKSVTINQQNRLLLQKFKLNSLFENQTNIFNVSVNGSGSGLVQFTVKYNIKKEIKSKQDFSLKISSKIKNKCKSVTLEVQTSFNQVNEVSSMAIVNFRLPSGWIPIEQSLEELKNVATQLKRYEINENKVSLYFDEISNEGKIFEFEVTKAFDVSDVKPGIASVYDYYESQENSVNQEFILPC